MGGKVCGCCVGPKGESGEVKEYSSRRSSFKSSQFDLHQINNKLSYLADYVQKIYRKQNEGDFQLIVNKHDCKVSSKQVQDGYILKSWFLIPFEPQIYLQFTSDVSNRLNWDQNVQSARIVLEQPNLRIVHTIYKRILTIAPRESLIASKRVKIGEDLLDINTSVLSDSVPVGEDNVRIDMKFSGYFFQSVPQDAYGNIVAVTGISHVDFGFTPALAKIAKAFTVTAIPRFTKNLIKAIEISKYN